MPDLPTNAFDVFSTQENAEVGRLNGAARELLKAEGQLGPDDFRAALAAVNPSGVRALRALDRRLARRALAGRSGWVRLVVAWRFAAAPLLTILAV